MFRRRAPGGDKSVFEQIFGISGREFFDVGTPPRWRLNPEPDVKRYRVGTVGGRVVIEGQVKEVAVNGVVVWRAPEVSK